MPLFCVISSHSMEEHAERRNGYEYGKNETNRSKLKKSKLDNLSRNSETIDR